MTPQERLEEIRLRLNQLTVQQRFIDNERRALDSEKRQILVRESRNSPAPRL